MIQKENMRLWHKLLIGLIGLVLCALAAFYFGGKLFFSWHNLNENNLKIFSLIDYYREYKTDKKTVSRIFLCYFGVFIPLFAFLVFLLWNQKKTAVHGNARFSTESEIEEAGLFPKFGTIIGIVGKRILAIKDSLHIAMISPTRGGKGVGIVIPNLLTWVYSCVVTDVKKENFLITSRIRKLIFKNEIYVFDPFNENGITHRMNPLTYVNTTNKAKMIDDIQMIASYVIKSADNTDPIWTETPKMLFIGICLYLFETPGKPVTLGQVRRETAVHGDCADYYKALIQQRKDAGSPLSPECVEGLMSYAGIEADATRAGIIAGLRANLALWQSPILDAATSASDFDFRDLRKKKMTIYNCTSVPDLRRSTLINEIFWGLLVDSNTRVLPEQDPTLKYQVMLVLDEFGLLGRLSKLLDSVAFIAGYGLRLLTIYQSPMQLVPVYKSKEAVENFLDNHHAHIIYTPPANDNELSEKISRTLGYYDLETNSYSRPSFNLSGKQTGSVSTSIQKRALMLPEELKNMPYQDQIVIYRDTRPIRSKKAFYYAVPVFKQQLFKVSTSLAATNTFFNRLFNRPLSKKQIDAAAFKGELATPIAPVDMQEFNATVDMARRISDAVMTILQNQEDGQESENQITNLGKTDKIPEKQQYFEEIYHENLENVLELPLDHFNFDPISIEFGETDPIDAFEIHQLSQ